jgi:hypothetical protein
LRGTEEVNVVFLVSVEDKGAGMNDSGTGKQKKDESP